MRTLTIRLVGTTPFLLHRICRHEFRDELAFQPTPGKPAEKEVWANMVTDGNGNPAVPASWLWDALRRAAARANESGADFSKILSNLQFAAAKIPLEGREGEELTWSIYRSIQHRAPGSRESIVVVAPMFRRWELRPQVFIFADHAFVNPKLIQKVWDEAGKCGIGLFHPPKKHFGQFRATVCCVG